MIDVANRAMRRLTIRLPTDVRAKLASKTTPRVSLAERLRETLGNAHASYHNDLEQSADKLSNAERFSFTIEEPLWNMLRDGSARAGFSLEQYASALVLRAQFDAD